jgi:hypothetical protein
MNQLVGFLQHFYHSALKKDKHDWEIILYCLGTASLFWILNAMGKVYHHRISVPIEYVYDAKKFVAVSSLPTEIQVEVEGRGWDLGRQIWAFDPSVFKVKIDKPLETNFLAPRNWTGKFSEMIVAAKVISVSTDTIFCRFDRIEKKLVGLYVDLQDIKLRPGYQISSPVRLNPKFIEFVGAASITKNLPEMLPLKVDARNVSESFDQNVPIDFSDEYPKNQLLNYSQEVINVQFSVRPSLEEELEIPISLLHQNAQPRLYLKEKKVSLTFLVSDKDKLNLKSSDFIVYADFQTFNPADSTVEVKLAKSPKAVSDVQIGIEKTRVYAR